MEGHGTMKMSNIAISSSIDKIAKANDNDATDTDATAVNKDGEKDDNINSRGLRRNRLDDSDIQQVAGFTTD